MYKDESDSKSSDPRTSQYSVLERLEICPSYPNLINIPASHSNVEVLKVMRPVAARAVATASSFATGTRCCRQPIQHVRAIQAGHRAHPLSNEQTIAK